MAAPPPPPMAAKKGPGAPPPPPMAAKKEVAAPIIKKAPAKPKEPLDSTSLLKRHMEMGEHGLFRATLTLRDILKGTETADKDVVREVVKQCKAMKVKECPDMSAWLGDAPEKALLPLPPKMAAKDPFADDDPFADLPQPKKAEKDPFADDDPFADLPQPKKAEKDPFADDDPFADVAPAKTAPVVDPHKAPPPRVAPKPAGPKNLDAELYKKAEESDDDRVIEILEELLAGKAIASKSTVEFALEELDKYDTEHPDMKKWLKTASDLPAEDVEGPLFFAVSKGFKDRAHALVNNCFRGAATAKPETVLLACKWLMRQRVVLVEGKNFQKERQEAWDLPFSAENVEQQLLTRIDGAIRYKDNEKDLRKIISYLDNIVYENAYARKSIIKLAIKVAKAEATEKEHKPTSEHEALLEKPERAGTQDPKLPDITTELNKAISSFSADSCRPLWETLFKISLQEARADEEAVENAIDKLNENRYKAPDLSHVTNKIQQGIDVEASGKNLNPQLKTFVSSNNLDSVIELMDQLELDEGYAQPETIEEAVEFLIKKLKNKYKSGQRSSSSGGGGGSYSGGGGGGGDSAKIAEQEAIIAHAQEVLARLGRTGGGRMGAAEQAEKNKIERAQKTIKELRMKANW